MGFIRAAIWTALCVGFGVFAATYEIDGRTPLEHVQQKWRSTDAPHQLDKLVVSAKTKVEQPIEQISKADRESLNSLIAKKTK